jgi:hypothetical protein
MENFRPPRRDDIYQEFINWSAMGPFRRREMGITEQKDFAKHFGVSEDTLTRWKQRPDFEKKIRSNRKGWAFEKEGPVIEALYKSAVGGNAANQRLWMKLFSGFQVGGKNKEPEIKRITINEVQQLIDDLPEWRKKKYKDLMRDLIDDASLFANNDPDMTEEEYKRHTDHGL